MKFYSILFLVCFFPLLGFGQVITLQVLDAFEYTLESENYMISIIEKPDYEKTRGDYHGSRKIEFDNKLKDLYKYLELNNIEHSIIPSESNINEFLEQGLHVLHRVEIELSADQNAIDNFKKVAETKHGLTVASSYQIEMPDSLRKSSLSSLEKKARAKADQYAMALGVELGIISEIKIIQDSFAVKSRGIAGVPKLSKASNYVASFRIEFSFETTRK